MKTPLLIVSMLFAQPSGANQTPIDQLHFQDAKLEQCVSYMAKEAHVSSADQLEYLQCAFKGSLSLKGIQQLPALKSLVLSGGEIKDLGAINRITSLRDMLLNDVYVSNFSSLNNKDLDVVLSRVSTRNWQQLSRVHVSTISIKSPGQCNQYKSLANNEKVVLAPRGTSDKRISVGMQQVYNGSKNVFISLDCDSNDLN